MPTWKVESVKDVTVRHVPLTEMLSPKWQSVRMGATLEIVRVVPPSVERGLRADTTGFLLEKGNGQEFDCTSYCFDYSGKHFDGRALKRGLESRECLDILTSFYS